MGGESEAWRLLDRDAGLLQGRLFLAILDGGDAAFHRAHAVQVFIELLLVGCGQRPPQVPGAAEDEVQHASIQSIHR